MDVPPVACPDWQTVVEAHRLESQDAEAWLRYGIALLQTLEPGLGGIERQQQASQAFCKARQQGVSAGAVALALRSVVLQNLREAVQLVGLEDLAPRLVEQDESAGFTAATRLIGRRLLLVLGMHRSGTSALSGLLGQVGFQAPTNPDPADVKNPTGYWEPPQIRRFHDRLIEGCQSSWEDPLLPVLPWQPEQPEAALVELEEAIAADFVGCASEAVALVKDPRQCRLMPLWNQLLASRPLVAQAVLLLRHPEAVAASLWRRDELPADRALLLWLTHTLEAERHGRALPRAVLSYEGLLADPASAVSTCQRLAGLPEQPAAPELLVQWIRPELNHGCEPAEASGLAEAGELLELAVAVYGALLGPEGATAQQRCWSRLNVWCGNTCWA